MTRPALLILLLSMGARAVTLLQTEDFQTSTDWGSGPTNPNPPTILADSGPLGPGDSALWIVADGGSGAGSRLAADNETFWTGDFSGQGITSLEFDLRNIGITNLSIHFVVYGAGGEFITPGQEVDRFQPWSHHTFSLAPGDLISVGGSDVDATLADVTKLRIIHSTANTSFRGDVINGQLLVDNLTAVPEPSSFLFLTAAVALTLRRKR